VIGFLILIYNTYLTTILTYVQTASINTFKYMICHIGAELVLNIGKLVYN